MSVKRKALQLRFIINFSKDLAYKAKNECSVNIC